MAQFKLDTANLAVLDAALAARLDAMSDPDLTAAARSDPDNPPLSDDELARIASARRVREVRARSGLSQQGFAKAYRINIARLRDLEQGRTRADSALLAYLAVINGEPEAVLRALG